MGSYAAVTRIKFPDVVVLLEVGGSSTEIDQSFIDHMCILGI
jgi:hypothetical protein